LVTFVRLRNMSKFSSATFLKGLLFALPFFLFSSSVNTFEDLLEALETQTYDYVQEKVYLHLDKPYYSKGDDLWFKAYTVAGPNHTPTPLSENLYVELINEAQGEVIKRITVYLNKGLGIGDFVMADSLAAGDYTVRAYTNWMRNFDEGFYFQKSIKLIDPIAPNVPAKLLSTESDPGVQVRFFPEGGELIAGVTSKIAFEIPGAEDGLTGQIIDDNDNVISKLTISHEGLGSFSLKPIAGKNYFAQIDGNPTKHALPSYRNDGFVLAVDNLSHPENIIVNVKTSDLPGVENEAYLIAHTRGLVGFASKIEWKGREARVSIPRQDLASGLVHVTVFNNDWQPEAERLIFKRQKEESINISLTSDKEQYVFRDSTTIKLKLENENGEPLIGSFSMSVFDTTQISPSAFNDNIVSSIFLSSDIKGKIDSPNQYFDLNNPTADQDLDMLLMSRGWRRFVWKDILNEKFPETTFEVEQGFDITGKLQRRGSQKAVTKGSVRQIGTFNGLPSLEEATSKGNGSFEMKNLLYYEDISFIQAVDKKGKNNVELLLDSIISSPFNNSVAFGPAAYKKPMIVDEDFIERSKERKIIDSVFSFENVTDLGTVVVQGTKNDVVSANISRGLVFNRGEYGLDVTDLMAKGQKFRNALYLLQGRIPGITIIPGQSGEPTVLMTRKVESFVNPDPPILYLLDDAQTSLAAITAIPAELIARVEVLKGMRASGIYGASGNGGAIAFYTKTPAEFDAYYAELAKNNVYVSKNSKRLEGGYYSSREFYGPDYSEEKFEHTKPDHRDLIHWAPMVFTDANGEASVTFYNADLSTTVQVNLEGIWEGGIPLAKSINYEVKRK